MALSAQTAQFISQLGLLTYIDPSGGAEGPHSTVAFRLVPTSGWHNSQRFPHDAEVDLKLQGYKTTSLEGVEYYLVPDETSTNVPGTISHYAQRTAPGDLANPPGGGVNRSLESVDYAAHTVAPDAVSKYVKENDNWEDARTKESELDQRVRRQIGH